MDELHLWCAVFVVGLLLFGAYECGAEKCDSRPPAYVCYWDQTRVPEKKLVCVLVAEGQALADLQVVCGCDGNSAELSIDERP